MQKTFIRDTKSSRLQASFTAQIKEKTGKIICRNPLQQMLKGKAKGKNKEPKMIFETGRVVMKIAGRDSGKTAVIVDKIDDNYVLIDGETRRKKCNISHLEPTEKTLKISANASTEEVIKAFKEIGININPKVKKEKKEIKEEKPKKEIKKNKG